MQTAPGEFESPDLPLVVAVVLTWNDTEMTMRCVESILRNDYGHLHVLLVDNGSATPCGEMIAGRFPEIELMVLPKNLGFSGGANRGLERAVEIGAEFIHLIGNDSTLAPDVISNLVRDLQARRGAGAASPLILYPREEKTVEFYRGTVQRDCARHIQYGKGVLHASRTWATVENEFVPFVAAMLRREALADVGLLDETLCVCWEDYDFCIRLSDGGWSIVTTGDAEVVHLGSATTGRISPYITYYETRNRLICLFRYGRPLGILRQGLLILRSFYWQIEGYGFANWRCHRAFLRGLFDFAIGVRGEGNPPRNPKR